MSKNIGQYKIEQRIKNTNIIFETLCRLGGEGTLQEIKSILKRNVEQHNRAIAKELENKYERGEIIKSEMERELKRKSIREITSKTIQRCTKDDPRIESHGRKYMISAKARLELRDLDPEISGLQIFRETMNFIPTDNLDERILDYIQRFGAFIFFMFIEATRPLDDSFNLKDRQYLVEYWAQHAIPLDDMLNFFQGQFAKRRKQDFKTPMNEMDEDNIKELLDGLKRTFPEIYSRLTLGRSKSFSRKGST
jgi:hypothetical protein